MARVRSHLRAAVWASLLGATACQHPTGLAPSAAPATLNGGTVGGGVLSVLVQDHDDKAIAGAEVFLFCAGDPPGSASCTGVAGPIFTDAHGRASMQGLPRGAYTVQIRSRDARREWQVTMTPGGSAGNTIEFDFTQ